MNKKRFSRQSLLVASTDDGGVAIRTASCKPVELSYEEAIWVLNQLESLYCSTTKEGEQDEQ